MYLWGDFLITAFTGRPGSGKSVDSWAYIIGSYKEKKPVICNFPVSEYYTNVYYCKNINPVSLIDFGRKYNLENGFREGQILLIIDECQMIFNSRNWQANFRWIEFFTQHRKLGYDVILIMQDLKMIDKQIRDCVEYVAEHRRYSRFGRYAKFIGWLFGGDFIVLVRWAGSKEVIRRYSFEGTKKLYGVSDTTYMV